ncbi:MAG: flagellar hook-length control protein FliK [Hyphomicrobiaceae bacterium]|nr:flagellar hook-length control protein FliK [Hyphomicrobiaceae bacterium]MCC0024240.1 flagellar hook-length control protein FliK [Hyphomicrobiaceae bacterium]
MASLRDGTKDGADVFSDLLQLLGGSENAANTSAAPGTNISQTSSQSLSIKLGNLKLGGENGINLDDLSALIDQLTGNGGDQSTDLDALAGLADTLIQYIDKLLGHGDGAPVNAAGDKPGKTDFEQALALTRKFLDQLHALGDQDGSGLGDDFKKLLEDLQNRLQKINSNEPARAQLRQTLGDLGLARDGLKDLAGTSPTSAEIAALMRSQNQQKQADLAQKNGLDIGNPHAAKPGTPAAAAPLEAIKDAIKPQSGIDAALLGKSDGQSSGAQNSTPYGAAGTQAQQSAFANALGTQLNGDAPRINIPAMAYEITRHVQAGLNRFQIRLDPPELGRIDVRMDVDHHGALSARLTVERPETLDLLTRDARALERALQQSGLDSAKTNLQFALKQNPFSGQNGSGSGFGQNLFGGGNSPASNLDSESEVEAPAQILQTYRGWASPGGLNLVV